MQSSLPSQIESDLVQLVKSIDHVIPMILPLISVEENPKMSDYILSCCSTADMPLEYFQKRNIPFVCFHFAMDGKEYPDDLGQSMSFDEFYKRIAAGALPTTSQVNVEQFVDFFESYLAEGKDILHISFSSGLSGTYNSALKASEQLLQKYPNRKIVVVDSLGASSGYGLLVDMAADLRDGGGRLEDVSAWVEENKLNLQHWFFSTDLTHYRRGGRISAASATMGTLLNICPLMNMNHEGKLTSAREDSRQKTCDLGNGQKDGGAYRRRHELFG